MGRYAVVGEKMAGRRVRGTRFLIDNRQFLHQPAFDESFNVRHAGRSVHGLDRRSDTEMTGMIGYGNHPFRTIVRRQVFDIFLTEGQVNNQIIVHPTPFNNLHRFVLVVNVDRVEGIVFLFTLFVCRNRQLVNVHHGQIVLYRPGQLGFVQHPTPVQRSTDSGGGRGGVGGDRRWQRLHVAGGENRKFVVRAALEDFSTTRILDARLKPSFYIIFLFRPDFEN
jgi:hypothetical protein